MQYHGCCHQWSQQRETGWLVLPGLAQPHWKLLRLQPAKQEKDKLYADNLYHVVISYKHTFKVLEKKNATPNSVCYITCVTRTQYCFSFIQSCISINFLSKMKRCRLIHESCKKLGASVVTEASKVHCKCSNFMLKT